MNRQNRNLILIIAGAVLALCCCVAIVAAVAFGWLLPIRSYFDSQPEARATVAVIVSTATPAPAATVTCPASTPSTSGTRPAPTATGAAAATAAAASADAPNTESLLSSANMPQRDLRELALRLKPDVGDIPVTVNATSPNYNVGDQVNFWVENSDTQEHRQISATLRFKTDHVYMFVENGVNMNDRSLGNSAERFERDTYPTNREFFGSEWTPGVDNDPHLSVLHARGLGENIAGYYSSADEFSRKINQYSNEREMFYISADSRGARPDTAFYDGVLAHEFQHMIHWAQDRNEDSWVNEGMSELASHLNGYDVGGADVAYAERPDTQLNTWSDPSAGNAEHYGASYLFMSYFLGRFGEDLTKAIVASPQNGIAGINDALQKSGRQERFNDVFADWLIANLIDHPDGSSDKRFGYPDTDPPSPAFAEMHSQFPAQSKGQVSQYGVDYIRLKTNADMRIQFQGATKVKLVGTTPKGKYSWWSNRGDDSDATLTRAFDLHGVSSATLTYSAWYDIEDGWDYAYVAVSTDGGKRWQLQQGRHATNQDKTGNAFGPAYTGTSGAGTSPQWVEDRIDLTKFAGQEILLRFEYVTDDAVNGPGLMIDNLAIPEINYRDDGEAGMGGWDAKGWVLNNNELTQHWLVQVLSLTSGGMKLQRMDIGADGRGELILENGANLQEAILIVSANAPTTTETATYNYTISPR